ncbi:MAG: ABC transporter permease [Polyangiales bacterium]
MSRRRLAGESMVLAIAGAVLVAFLAAPLLALVVTTDVDAIASGLRHPLVAPALRLSSLTTSTSLALVVVFGTPLAWTLSRSEGRFARTIETVIQLPAVIPPAVAGLAMLLAFGRRGLFSGWLYPRGSSVTFTTAAVVIAEVFVSAPFFVQAATSAFRRIDPRLIVVARSFGASPWRVLSRVAIPIAAPGLVAGAAMSWARSLGEFGATLMFAGNLQGRTQTLPLAIYTALESDLRAAQAISIVLLFVAVSLLVFVRALLRRSSARDEVST